MHINGPRQHFIDNLIELLGIKGGLGLLEGQAVPLFSARPQEPDDDYGWWVGDPADWVRLEAGELENTFVTLAYNAGVIPAPTGTHDVILSFLTGGRVLSSVPLKERVALMPKAIQLSTAIARHILNEEPLPSEFAALPGVDQAARDFAIRFILDEKTPPSCEWDGRIPLRDLFMSEDIPENCAHDTFFDQRYIDYLNAQPDEVANMHWRQFEYLTGEYFRRNGYDVEVTPPRNDGGTDVVARRDDALVGPELVLVQCKRHAEDNPVDIEVVKAFWSTVNDAKATRGLVATTSRIAPGARNYCQARQYRLSAAEADAITRWIASMGRWSPPHG